MNSPIQNSKFTIQNSGDEVLEIRPSSGWRAIDFREIWRFRELFGILVWRDLKVRYRQTALGVVWVVVQPVVSMLIFTFLFNRVAGLKAAEGLPYSVYVFAALLPWTFFASGLSNAGNSLLGSSHLISKVYFPRLIVPAAAVLVGLADMAVSGLLLAGLMLYHRVSPGPTLVLLALPTVLALALALGMGLWLSALNVEYRDFRVVIPFLVQIWTYATPVAYPLAALPAKFRKFAIFNPMTGVVETFRACLFHLPIPWGMLGVSALEAVVVLVSGAFYFRRMERQFADVI
ncbi:MAG: ABC transporter permease [Thermoanaerobaculia bacterium]